MRLYLPSNEVIPFGFEDIRQGRVVLATLHIRGQVIVQVDVLVNHCMVEVAAPVGVELEEIKTFLPYLKGSRPGLLDLIC